MQLIQKKDFSQNDLKAIMAAQRSCRKRES